MKFLSDLCAIVFLVFMISPSDSLTSSPTNQMEIIIKEIWNSINELSTNSCSLYNPPMPNFKAIGRRISEVKCYEYIWQMKTREDRARIEQGCNNLETDLEYHILKGNFTNLGQYPHMGALGWNTNLRAYYAFLCGSSLISSKFILTAGHCCVMNSTLLTEPTPKIVRFGVINRFQGKNAIDVEIIRIIKHPSYIFPSRYFDIAIMELGREVQFSMRVQPGCLWGHDDILFKTAEISGWGVYSLVTKNISRDLLTAHIDIVDFVTCKRLLTACDELWCGLKDHQLCAGNAGGGVDTCWGDSGGPIQVKIPLPNTTEGAMVYILGVTSFGFGCGIPNLPGIYTKVSSFIDWIENIVWPEK